MAFLIVHPEWGICLGHLMGLVFWSKLNPIEQPTAATFTETEAREMIEQLRFPVGEDQRSRMSLVEVEPDFGEWASMGACVRAGQEAWFSEAWTAANELPC